MITSIVAFFVSREARPLLLMATIAILATIGWFTLTRHIEAEVKHEIELQDQDAIKAARDASRAVRDKFYHDRLCAEGAFKCDQ